MPVLLTLVCGLWSANAQGLTDAPPLAASLRGAPSVADIIHKSVEANHRDFQELPKYAFTERDRNQNGDHTYNVTMIDGWQYYRLIAVNGKPLPPDQEKQQAEKARNEERRRNAMSVADRQQAIQKYERERQRNNNMMDQMIAAFNFQLQGQRTIKGHPVWVLRATPKAHYQPPNRDAQVLTGMQGELWIDQNSYHWVRVTASVVRPVSIEGFLATVEPGTHFELEKIRVADDFWAPSHFVERAEAKVLLLFNHREHEDDTFWDYHLIK